jgi:hypothetical protein
MSCLTSQSTIWAPDTIATVVYRVVMIVVSLAFLWRQYHLPKRFVDGKHSSPIYLDLILINELL